MSGFALTLDMLPQPVVNVPLLTWVSVLHAGQVPRRHQHWDYIIRVGSGPTPGYFTSLTQERILVESITVDTPLANRREWEYVGPPCTVTWACVDPRFDQLMATAEFCGCQIVLWPFEVS